ncbi:hypothetical protein [uncultured Salinicola sp.]|uniref:hypothetical protein n=1 Tax=uncultured Salinicola sp. TaxID=1193542 RepID=UPI0026081445|nr:hypothetical protein [uncultured Salinicola sp.]
MKKLAIATALTLAGVSAPAIAQSQDASQQEQVRSEINLKTEETRQDRPSVAASAVKAVHNSIDAGRTALTDVQRKKIKDAMRMEAHKRKTIHDGSVLPTSIVDEAIDKLKGSRPKCCIKCPTTIGRGKVPTVPVSKVSCISERKIGPLQRMPSILKKI